MVTERPTLFNNMTKNQFTLENPILSQEDEFASRVKMVQLAMRDSELSLEAKRLIVEDQLNENTMRGASNRQLDEVNQILAIFEIKPLASKPLNSN